MNKYSITIQTGGTCREMLVIEGTDQDATNKVNDLYLSMGINVNPVYIKLANEFNELVLNKHTLDNLIRLDPLFFASHSPMVVVVKDTKMLRFDVSDKLLSDLINSSILIYFHLIAVKSELTMYKLGEHITKVAHDFNYPLNEMVHNFNKHLGHNEDFEGFVRHVYATGLCNSYDDVRAYLWENAYITAGYLSSDEVELCITSCYGELEILVKQGNNTLLTLDVGSKFSLNRMRKTNGQYVFGKTVRDRYQGKDGKDLSVVCAYISNMFSEGRFTFHKEGDKIIIKNRNQYPEYYIQLPLESGV